MKNIKKYISVVVIAIAMTITFSAINTNKTNKSVKMQNKEALAVEIDVPCIFSFNAGCHVEMHMKDGGTVSCDVPLYWEV